MGASTFMNFSEQKTAMDAFKTLRDQAAWESGHGGYTGTIAEKSEFIMVGPVVETVEEAREVAKALIDSDDKRISDKWGPAGCIDVRGGGFLFFGWASS